MRLSSPKPDPRSVVDLSLEALKSTKGEDIIVLDLRGLTDVADYFIICTGNSDTHVKALAENLIEALEKESDRPWHVEGYESRKWVLVDSVDVVTHIFQTSVREFYRLERLWGDAKMEIIADEEDADRTGEDEVDRDQTSSVAEVI